MTIWSIASAAVPGPGRGATMDRCKAARVRDASGEDFLILTMADGAGSARRGGEGAEIATDAFIKVVMASARRPITLAPRRLAFWHGFARRAVRSAPSAGETVSDYNCTFIAAVIGATSAGAVQVGDGVLAVRAAGRWARWRPVFAPQSGRFANETVFIGTSTVPPQIAATRTRPAAFALFTDGLDPILYNSAAHSVSSAVLEQLSRGLRRLPDDAARDRALSDTLRMEAIQSRVSDDTALLIARRR